MKILSIDTSTKFLCLGLYADGKEYTFRLETGRKLSSLISVEIKRALDGAGLSIREIDYFACGLGPGSFTGLRIGVVTVKGLSFALKKPFIGIPSLDLLARNALSLNGTIIPVIDAKRELVYSCIYRAKDNKIKRASGYMLLNLDELFKKIKAGSIILGDALSIYQERILRNTKRPVFLDKDYWYPEPHNLIALALERVRLKKFSDPSTIKPIYLYAKECQVTALKRAGQ